MYRFLTKKESLILLICVSFLLLALVLIHPQRSGSEFAAQVTSNGKVVMILDLNQPGIYHIDALIPVTLEVNDGAIRFIDSVCPNHDCEAFGYIDTPFETAICLPAKVAVQIIEQK